MFCSKCGAEIPDGMTRCPNCGEITESCFRAEDRMEKPNNYLVWAILVTIFCCLPCGIVSSVYAASVDSAYYAGDYARSLSASKNARTWMWVSLICGVVVFIATILFYTVLGGAALMSTGALYDL